MDMTYIFGMPGCNTNLNVLDCSPLIGNMLRADSDRLGFEVDGNDYPRYYHLAHQICPKGVYIYIYIFLVVQTITALGDVKRYPKAFHKYVEHACGILQSRWWVIANLCRMWYMDDIFACIIMYNMIVKDEKQDDLSNILAEESQFPLQMDFTFEDLQCKSHQFAYEEAYFALYHNFIEHLWEEKGNAYILLLYYVFSHLFIFFYLPFFCFLFFSVSFFPIHILFLFFVKFYQKNITLKNDNFFSKEMHEGLLCQHFCCLHVCQGHVQVAPIPNNPPPHFIPFHSKIYILILKILY